MNELFTDDFVESDVASFIEHASDSIDLEGFDNLDSYLEHHGTKGQKWGNRKYQNSDGSLTPLGRVHYGVGAARKSAGSAASKVGTAIRKKVNPNEKDLQEKYQKAVSKQKRRELKDATKAAERAAKGKQKRVKDMSDEELRQNIQRLQNEKQLKELRKEARATTKAYNSSSKAMQAGTKFVAGVGKATVGGLAGFVGSSVNTLATSFVRKGSETLVNNIFKEKKSDEQKRSERLKREAEDAKNEFNIKRDTLQRQALSANVYVASDAARRLSVLTKKDSTVGENFIKGYLPAPKEDKK